VDIHQQLAALRKRVARIDAKYQVPGPVRSPFSLAPAPAVSENAAARQFVDEIVSGEVIENNAGKHFQTVKVYERHRRYGSMDISNLAELPHDLLEAISNGDAGSAPPQRWAFLDTETTGLAGGSGTYAFLVGVGSINSEGGFTVKQFFMRNYDEEPSMLEALTEHLKQFDILVTYNGKSYDQPLLETRYRMSRARPPFASMRHVDLLYGSRRLWKLRFDSCRLVELENRILGLERQGDLPGEMIPYVYFEFIRTQEAFRVAPILHHNVLDIVTLACLTAIVPFAFKSPSEFRFGHGAEMVGLSRWLKQAGQDDQAAEFLRAALDRFSTDARGRREELHQRAMWDLAGLEKKLGREDAAIALFTQLTETPNPHRCDAYTELAKHFEHREKNYGMALEMTRSALKLAETPDLLKRLDRLTRKGSARRLL
jgi:uncharacterized protein